MYGIVAILAGGMCRAPRRPQPSSQEYVFPSGAGVLFFHVRPERAEDFEAIVKRLSPRPSIAPPIPMRRLQAAHWNVYRSAETPRDAVVYLFFFDPAVSGADYDPIKVLSEDAPTDVSGLFERLRADIVRVERMGLTNCVGVPGSPFPVPR